MPDEKGNADQCSQPEECRIAIIEDGILEELYVERASQDNYVGNIYKGRIVNLEPSIQAAFVDFGVGRNGFLHISDVEPQYFRQGGYDPEGGRRGAAVRTATTATWATTTRKRPPASGGRAATAPATGRGSSRPSRRSSAAATKSWSR
jgi:hypothetical protein